MENMDQVCFQINKIRKENERKKEKLFKLNLSNLLNAMLIYCVNKQTFQML